MLAAIANQLDRTLRAMCLMRNCKPYSLCTNSSDYTISVHWPEVGRIFIAGFVPAVALSITPVGHRSQASGRRTRRRTVEDCWRPKYVSLPHSPGKAREVAPWALA